jgi:tmRNA-binding protein
VEVGLARGKLQRDRRHELQERDMRREAERAMKERNR